MRQGFSAKRGQWLRLGLFAAALCAWSASGCSDSAGGGVAPTTTLCDPVDFEVDTSAENTIESPGEMVPLDGPVLQIHRGVYMVAGFSNTFLVTTEAGSIVIDTSIAFTAPAHEQALRPYVVEPLRYVILTHNHPDHIGGVALWRGEDSSVEVLAQKEAIDLAHYQRRLDGIFRNRNSAQFSRLLNLPPLPFNSPDAPVVNDGGEVLGTIHFEEFFQFSLGDLTIQVVHTPGETPDHLSVWIPELRMAFPGDNFYLSFPNLYTLRGTRPRPALDYISSLDTVLSWRPEVLAPSHGNPLYGESVIAERVGGYRDAISYVHDETVRGINAGKDIFTLMREISLPPELETADTNEVYGRIDWSVRGIYDGYVGWFDGNVSNMTAMPASAVYPEIVVMAGGPDALADRAAALVEESEYEKALHLADIVLNVSPEHSTALEARADGAAALLGESSNLNSQGWYNAAIREVESKLEEVVN